MDKNPHLPGTADEFISKNLGLAHYVAHGFIKMARKNDSIRFDDDDFISIAYLGLARAYQRFDPTKFKGTNGESVKFSTYAVPMIRGAIMRHIRDLGHTIRTQGKSVAVDSLDRPLEDSESRTMTLGEKILTYVCEEDNSIFLRDFLNTLNPRLRKVYKLWSMDLSQDEIGKIFGISQVSVSRMERYILESARLYGLGMDLKGRTRHGSRAG